jgi:hypothetical protein
MLQYNVSLNWKADPEGFSYKKYSHTHQWTCGGGSSVKNENNKLAVTKVILRPGVVFSGEKAPDETELKKDA